VPCFFSSTLQQEPTVTNPEAPITAFRRTPEDASNIADIAAALRTLTRRPFVNATDTLRAALRVAGEAARRGELQTALARYRDALAGG